VKVRRLGSTALEKVWGTAETEPWYPRGAGKTGEVWFCAPEEPRLLVKFLFTAEKLSVQVHPPDSAGPGKTYPGKTEMWHVLRAGPDARLALGFERPLNRDEARAAALSGEIEGLLHWYAAEAGDTFFVPAGTVHAIGAGFALCEIQQYSDVTYRLYDYGRPRELHLDAALAVADLGGHPAASAPVDLGNGRRLLVECPYFRTESITVDGVVTWPSAPHTELLVCLDGDGQFGDEAFAPGQVWVVPERADVFSIRPHDGARLLRVWVPDVGRTSLPADALSSAPKPAAAKIGRPTSGTLASSVAAVASALAALSCCLPLGPFVLAAGSAGASGLFLSLQPYLIAFSVLLLAVGFVQAFRARKCGRGRRALNVTVLLCSTGLVAAMLFLYVPASAPAGQPAVAALHLDSFRQLFNAAAERTRVVMLLSPT
jgi:mannose-6-phosphate isomerase